MNGHVAALQHLAQAGHARGLGHLPTGLGIPGPFGQVSKQMLAADDLYEISGTQVALHDPQVDPSTLKPSTSVIGYFNNKYGDNGGMIVGEPDAVMTNGQTADANGYTWVQVAVSGGALAGKAGYVALKYLAPRGWTAKQGKVTQTPPAVVDNTKNANEGDSDKPPAAMTGDASDKWKPWLIGGIAILAVLGGGYLLMSGKSGQKITKKIRRRARAHARLRRIRRKRHGRRR